MMPAEGHPPHPHLGEIYFINLTESFQWLFDDAGRSGWAFSFCRAIAVCAFLKRPFLGLL